jgi:hypothetical protein
VRVELEDDVELFYWTKPRHAALEDIFEDPRPPMHPHSVGFVLHAPFLESVADSIVKAVQPGETPVVSLTTKDNALAFVCYGADPLHSHPPRGVYQGELPMVRSMPNTDHISISVRADSLLQAIKGLGDSAQFIVPYNDVLGLQTHPIDPFYVNCNSSQFALMTQYVLDRDRVYHLEKLRRKVQNAREGM